MRDEMLEFVLDAELLKFALNGPALSPLFQLPPTLGKLDALTLPLSAQQPSTVPPFVFDLVRVRFVFLGCLRAVLRVCIVVKRSLRSLIRSGPYGPPCMRGGTR